MDLKRFLVASIYRGASEPMPVKAPLPVALFSMHAATLYAAGSLPFDPPSAAHLGGCALTYVMLTFGITGGHHRYFSHRSYQTSRSFQFGLGVLGCLAWQRGPIWWASQHNHHHQHSDTLDDPHSPVTGSALWSHMGWYWASAEHDAPRDVYVRKWRAYPELVLLDKLHFTPGLAYLSALYTLGGGEAVLWGFVVPVVGCWHAIFSIGSLCHGTLGGGSRPFEKTGPADTSKNVWWVGLLTLGDGFHNNHHAFRWSAAAGLRWYEPDVTFAMLRVLEAFGIVWDLKVPSAEQIAKASRSGATSRAGRVPAAAAQ